MAKVIFDHSQKAYHKAIGISRQDLLQKKLEVVEKIGSDPRDVTRSEVVEIIMRMAQEDEQVLMMIIEDWISDTIEEKAKRFLQSAAKGERLLPPALLEKMIEHHTPGKKYTSEEIDAIVDRAKTMGFGVPEDLMIVLNHECEKCRAYDRCDSPSKKPRDQVQGELATKAEGQIH